MTKSQRLGLRLSAAWSIWVWTVLIRNMVRDREHPVSFRVVHICLGVVSLAFAAATLGIARRVPPAEARPEHPAR